jgi:uncharacterized repeat protein (TIGR01451 family)/fimbrial isopeptide formation D2 family protein
MRPMIVLSGLMLPVIKIFFITIGLLLPAVNALAAPCDIKNSTPPFIDHDLTNNAATSASYCELCGYGYVTIVITNPYEGADMINMSVVEDLGSSGLVYDPTAPTPIRYTMNGTPFVGPAPTGAGSVLTFNLAGISLDSVNGNNNVGELTITFAVRRTSNAEGLVSANRNIRASLNYDTTQGCAVTPQNTGFDLLPLREPIPDVDKRGRNVDASQGGYSNGVFGNINDDVIWRIRIRNRGLAGLQDLKFDDLMQNGNFQINYACPTEGEASAIAAANGVGPVGNCVFSSNNINDFIVDNPFGETGTSYDGYEVDVPRNDSTFIYLVGKITSSCVSNKTNTVSNIEWGCEAQGPTGGISVTSSGVSAGSDSETLSSLAENINNNDLQVVRNLTGLNTGQPVGSRGLMTIELTNNTGGSIKNIHLRDILPPEYVVDSTYTPTLSINPRYGNYAGMIDRITWTNPAPNTFPLTSSNPAEPLSNTAPEFDLWSTTTHPNYPDQVNMLRHGDVAVITFRVVMIPPSYYDNSANLDVRVENTTDNTDPDNSTTLSNQLFVDFENFCNPGVQQHPVYPFNDNPRSDPEDLDINITGNELIFILTNNPAQPLPLQVALTNNGGHYADDYHAYISFGTTMEVVSAPGSCSIASPPLLEVWDDPADIPATATVYECNSSDVGTVAPGQTRTLDFEVIKTSNAARLAADDLSFRADVVGEITLSNGTPLWFPTPATAPIVNRANNYSLDGVRARVIGFNLIKDQVGICTENNTPPPGLPDLQIQIGEECTFHIETGGWFGFLTPGFTYIAVQDITVTDQFPDGQGYISSTDPYLTSDPEILSIALAPQTSPPLQTLDEGWIDWSFNQAVPAERITVKDKWFRVNVTSRLLNDPVDPIDPADPNNAAVLPNRHALLSTNVLNSVFQAVFKNDVTGLEEVYDLGPGTIGYPQESIRREDLTITEPNILVTKEVCNETLNGVGTTCSNFATMVDDGDTQDSYIYRVTLTNEASSVSVPRAPAYNITSTDILDASDLVLVVPFNADGLDNDADGLIDAADTDGEGSISDNIISNGTPATITFSHTQSSALLRINPGASVTLYYRVDPDDAVAPQQQLINTVTASFDSLEGDSGNQTVVQSANSTVGGARVYGTVPASATVQILPLQTQPKDIIALSNTPLAAAQPQPVSIGEEIEYELRTYIPVANLRDFFVRDELPAGISCKEAPVVDLDAAPYSAAGFFPGGQITPTCNNNLVYWYFGDQELTTATNNQLFEFAIRFIARVDNTATVNDSDVISNGVPATNAFVSYINEANTQITLNFDQADLIVNEPLIALTKTFESNINDAGDVITVTVTATNNGTATAYNLRVFDDLAAVSNLTFLSNVGGTDPPDNVDTTTFGGNRPVFSWNAANPDFAIAPGDTISFTFDISADIGAQPLEILDNTIQASWTSLPSRNTALNSGGSIGIDGDVDGMRNGTLPNNSADVINDYETTATAFTVVPAVIMSKTDLVPAQAPEVGAHRNFELVVQLPEGTTSNLVVTDQLDFAGTSYVLSNNANFNISYSFENIVSINGSPPDESVFTAFPADSTSGVAVWNIGQVVTASEDDTSGAPAITPVIRINYFARANNDLNTNTGTTLQNTATTSYNNGETGAVVTITDNTPVVTVTEPVLTVSKTVTPVTPLPITGGDVLEYVVTIPNSGNATAYDVNVVDTLPARLALDASFTPTAVIGGTPVAGFVATPAGAPNGPLVWGLGNGDASLDIPGGSTLVLTYRVVVDAATESNITLSNSVLVDWTSLEGASPYERTGVNCPTGLAPDDYCAGPAVSSINTTDNNSLTKTVVSDTYAPANDAIVRVGDTVTYQLALDLQEGTTRNVAVQDALPPGLAFVDIVSINGDNAADYTPPASGAGSNFSYASITAAALPAAGQTGNLGFTLGDVTNDPAGDATTDTLVIVYRARVVENVLSQTPSIVLSNTATLSYVDGNGLPVVDPARLQSIASITVQQPVMTAPAKTDRSGRTSPTNVNIATDVMNFQLESCNTTGLAPAYSIQLTDVLATQLDQASIAGPTNGAGQPDVIINGALATAGVDYTYTPPALRGGSLAVNLITAVNPGQCVTVNYDIGFYTDFGPNQSWNNSVTVDEYWSLPLQSGQLYTPLGPAIFTMTNVATIEPASKAMLSPVSGEATVGEEVLYRIAVPSVAANAALYDVVISDTLHPSLEYVSATEVSGTGLVVTNNTVAPGNVSLAIPQIPAGQQAVIELRARVANNASANAGISFGNTAGYNYAISAGGSVIVGGSATTATSLTIVEPQLAINKNVVNLSNAGNPPLAGDILRYTLALTAVGTGPGDNFTDVFDVRIDDSLSLGLAYQAGTATVNGAGNTITDPGVSGDGTATAQTLVWSLAAATADIDVAEGATVTITYDVVVLDSALANQVLSNSAAAQWTGLDGINANERTGTGTPVVNDYFTAPVTASLTIPDNTALAKSRLNDTYGVADSNVRIGDIVEYELRASLQEGQYNSVVLADTLPQGMVFAGVVQINGDTASPYSAAAPFVHANIAAPVVSGNPQTGPSTVTFTLGNVTNVSDNNAANDDFVIVYRARVLDNVFNQVNTTTLTNNALLSYTTAGGVATQAATSSVTLLQPVLSVAKSAAAAGGDTVIEASELVTYTVDVTNNGLAPAYDLLLQDTIPVGMRNGAATITMVSTTLAGTVLPGNPVPVYNAATGLASWNLDTGAANAYTIPAGETLQLVYQVQADANLGAGLTLTNTAVASRYYSFDDDAVPALGGVTGVAEIYGPSNTASTTLTSPTPGALQKVNPADLTVSVGETFSYTITVPATPLNIALHDVRIIDDLAASAADLSFVSVTKAIGSQPWTPVNSGTATSLVIEDLTNGIDIPANQQVAVDVTVRVENTATNVSGLLFNNTASYTYNQLPGDAATQQNGAADTTADMTIVGPDSLTLVKSGPAQMRIGTPDIFTLNVHNTGTATAWDLSITDLLPNLSPGGMCDSAPVITSAQVFLADGVTAVSAPLVQGTDFVAVFAGDPACTLTITMQSAAAALPQDNRLIVSYQAELDVDTPAGSVLTNVAGVTQWFSTDTAGAGASAATRTYSRVLTDGTVTVLDHEDALPVNTIAPVITMQKRVVNLTTGQNPGSDAQPGDTLRYSILMQNTSPYAVPDFRFIDELDALNVTPAFAAGTLNLVTVPAGATTTATSASGGASGTGLVDIGNLSLGVAGSATDTVLIEFDVTLVTVITSGTLVLNQGRLQAIGLDLPTDDPNVNGVDDPAIPGGEDPTQTLITSAPQFEVFKTSQDITGDPGILLSGDTLRYSISVKNIGSENAINARLRDQLPANTTYVANSTRLNGTAVADLTGGVPPLQNGILINAPENTTAGFMRADASATAGNVATVSFDVVINNNVVNGTVISNQGFLTADGAGSGLMPEKPSDDPATAVVDDPTLDVVGNQPLVDAHKTVSIAVDNNLNGFVDPGDVLRYTISISNMGATPATGVTFIDGVPANTTYRPDSATLNGIPLGLPGAIVSPLAGGIDVSSSDLTPPLPTAGNGTLSTGGIAVVSFDVTVNDGVVNAPGPAATSGTVISNQGSVDSNELPAELTDADGIDANGDQPTLIAVGNAQLLSITKQVAVVGGGPALAGGQLEYRVRVSNIGSVAASNVVITDDLPAQLSYLPGSGALNGLTTGVGFSDPRISADFAAVYGDLQPGLSAELRFIAQIDNALPIGTTITNTGNVSWNSPAQTDSASVSIDVGGTPGLANLNGTLWHDANFNNVFDSGELPLQGWTVDVYRGAQQLGTFTTDSNGVYLFNGLLPNDVGTDRYELRFRAPGAGANTAPLGLADSPAPYLDDLQRIYDIVVSSGSNVQNLNLPIDPNGVVYDSILRAPVAGATLTLLNASNGNTQVPAGCFVDAAQQNQVTLASGYYKFDLNFSGAGCSSGDAFVVQVTPPANGYVGTVSQIIPPTLALNDPAFSVPACPGSPDDRLSTSPEHCEIQASVFAPPTSVQPRTAGTAYYLKFALTDSADPYTRQIFNNHIPLDPELDEAVAISKTSSLLNVTRSQLVPYTITVNNSLGVPLQDMDIVDNYPAGFKYVANSARIDGVASEPVINGLQMTWPNQTLNAGEIRTIKMLLVVGSGVGEGEYVNLVQAINNRNGEPVSGQASATVRVIPDATFDCTDVIGKVFADNNMNGYQDDGEAGIPSARVVTARGIEAKSDKHGRFHITCAVVPNEDRGSNFIIKLDERSLPSGYRVTTENPRVERATRGKMLKFNFGAAIHRVVRLDMADAVFEPNSTEIRPQWLSRVSLLMEKLVEAPSVLRLAYMADVEDEDLVEDRLKATKKEIQRRWSDLDCCYTLEIETEIFWRRGRPADGEAFK